MIKPRTVQSLILDLSHFPADKHVRFFEYGTSNQYAELFVVEHDEDEHGNPTFLLETRKFDDERIFPHKDNS